jgi:predicted porin
MERKLIAAAVSSALALPLAAQAVEFSVSGHVNRAIISVDGGANDGDLQHVDSNASQTRFRFTGSEVLDSGLAVGVQWEVGGTGPFSTRHANVYLSSAGGKLTLGHGSRATDGMAHADLGGPSWLGGATNWCSYASAGPACPSNDGGRGPMLRYDTPAIGPANLAVSAADNEYWDAKIQIAGSMGDAGYDLRIGYIGEYDTTVVTDVPDSHPHTTSATAPAGDVVTASGSVGFGQGTSVSASWSQNRLADHEYQYVKVDHSYGDGSIGVYYKRGETDGGTEGSLFGVGIGHSLGSGATAYAGYRQMAEDGKDDVDLVLVGMRVAFN